MRGLHIVPLTMRAPSISSTAVPPYCGCDSRRRRIPVEHLGPTASHAMYMCHTHRMYDTQLPSTYPAYMLPIAKGGCVSHCAAATQLLHIDTASIEHGHVRRPPPLAQVRVPQNVPGRVGLRTVQCCGQLLPQIGPALPWGRSQRKTGLRYMHGWPLGRDISALGGAGMYHAGVFLSAN